MADILIKTLAISFAVQIFFFTFAVIFKSDKVTDLSYSLTFIVISWYALIYSKTFTPVQILLVFMVTIWGIRLALYLFVRILRTKKDNRFDGIRENFVKFAGFWFFQAITVWLIMLPVIISLTSSHPLGVTSFVLIGFTVWLFGLLIETFADWQKFKFKISQENKEKWIETGLWKYSRHPNYFGEITLWWGMFLIAVPYLQGVSWLVVVGPVFLTFILLFVTGIPPLENRYQEKYKNNDRYQAYKVRTSLIVPLPPK